MQKDRSKIGILDIGTLSLRFDIFAVDPIDLSPLESYRLIHRAGENTAAADLIAGAFDQIKKLAEQHGVARIVGGATGLFRREKTLAAKILSAAADRGIDLRVLSGEEELRLIAAAIVSFFPELPDSALLIDIGGGSSEVSVIKKGKLTCGESVPIGVLVAKSMFPPELDGRYSVGAVAAMEEFCAKTFAELRDRFEKVVAINQEFIIGSSGSARELERVLSSVGREFSLEQLDVLLAQIGDKSVEQLISISGIDSKRADLMVPGAIIFREAMRAFSLKRAKVSHFSLRHGILMEEIAARPSYGDCQKSRREK